MTATDPDVAGRIAVAFARVARGSGMEVPVGSVVTYAKALGALGMDDRSGAYWAGRAVLVSDPSNIEVYDRIFEAFWLGGARDPSARERPDEVPVVEGLHQRERSADPDSQVEGPANSAVDMRYSPVEILRHKDFALCSEDELAETTRLMAQVRVGGPMRRSRRWGPTRRADGRPDLRRSVRRALRTGGEPVRRSFKAPTQKLRRVVLVCDVSGSMEPYARALLRFAHAAVAGRARVEAFTLGTRLTPITRALAWRDPDGALARVAAFTSDRSGGTRLGEGLQALNESGRTRGAIVVILSDGWDRGDPDTLRAAMARLRRSSSRIVWVNPHKATPGYEPLAGGMAIALPFVDDFVEGHSLSSLETLAEVIAK